MSCFCNKIVFLNFVSSTKILLYGFCLIYLLFISFHYTYGNSPKTVDRRKWKEITTQHNYTETFKEQEVKEQKNTEQSFDFSRVSWFKYVIFSIIIVAMAYFIYRFISQGNLRFNEKVRKQKILTGEEIIEDMKETDFVDALKKALKSKNYKLAVRIHFLQILKNMTDSGFIKWKKHKTNRDYQNETRKFKWFSDFKNITRIYEIVWYGEFELKEDHYEDIKQVFDSFQPEII
jgi:hypothetical protein